MAFLGPSLRRRRVTERPGVRVAAAVLASILLNFVFWVVVWSRAFRMPEHAAPPQPIALSPLTSDQWDANRAIAGGAPPRVAPPPPQLPATPPPTPPREQGQVVDVAPSKDGRRPADSRFLSDRDSTVEKETKSRFAGRKFYPNTLPAPSDGAKRPPKEMIGQGGEAPSAAPGREGPKATGGNGAPRLALPQQQQQEKLALAPKSAPPGPGEIPVAPRGDRQEIEGSGQRLQLPGAPGSSEGGQRKSGKIDPRLLPDPSSMSRIAGGPSLDRLEGVAEGDETSLNTRSFKYATFYQRIYRSIAQEWNPLRSYDARDPDRRIYPVRERTTHVVIELDATGRVQKVRVVDRSGLDFLDDEAVRAVRAAGPFPNPPPGLVDADGQVRIAFGFTVSFERSARVQFSLPQGPSQRPYPE